MEDKSDVISRKKKVRRHIRDLLGNLSFEEKERRNTHVKERLFSLEVYRKAKNILFYASLPDEVDTFMLMRQAVKAKSILLPRISGESLHVYRIEDIEQDLEKSVLGIMEPKDSCLKADDFDIDAVIVPGLAFDKDRNRLGRGKGYYDRFLQQLSSKTTKIGLCFSFQVLDTLPHDPGDCKVDIVVTDNRII